MLRLNKVVRSCYLWLMAEKEAENDRGSWSALFVYCKLQRMTANIGAVSNAELGANLMQKLAYSTNCEVRSMFFRLIMLPSAFSYRQSNV